MTSATSSMVSKTFLWFCHLKLPLIGHLSPHRQIRILFVTMVGALLFCSVFIWLSNVRDDMADEAIYIAGDALMHTQRMGKATPNAVLGDPDAFKQLRDSRYEVTIDLNLLEKGGYYKGHVVERPKPAEMSILGDSAKIWTSTDNAASTILKLQSALTTFAQAVKNINDVTPVLLKLTEEMAAQTSQNGMASNQLLSSMVNLERSVNSILLADSVQPDAVLLVKKALVNLTGVIDGMPNEANASQPIAAQGVGAGDKLTELKMALAQYQLSVSTLLSHIQSYVEAKKAGLSLVSDNEDLRMHLITAQTNYRHQLESISFSEYALFLGAAVMFLVVISLTLVLMQDSYRYINDAQARRAQADMRTQQEEQLEHKAKQANDQNQAAILLLMNELQEIAGGDLTVKATVNNDITGAIADAVNYTVDELRSLVGRIATTSEQLVTAINQVEELAALMVNVGQQEAEEINVAENKTLSTAAGQTHHTVLQMTDSVSELTVLAQELQNAVSRFRISV